MKKISLLVLAAAAVLCVSGCSKKAKVVINSADDLVGKTIGVQSGTTGEIYVEDVENAVIKPFKTGIDAALALKNGAIDAIVLDELPAKEIIKRNNDLKIVEASFSSEDYAIAVAKDRPELLESINNTIRTMKKDGRYDALLKAFILTSDGEATVPSDIESNGTEVIKMGTNAAFPPFEYTLGTKVVGFDATLAQYIAKDYNKKLQIVDMNFDGLIAALQSGAIDFIAAGMTATDERRQNVDFSDPYYTSNQVIIVRK